MVKFYDFEKNYMEAALAYKTIYETNDDSNALQNMVLYLLLVPHSPE